MLLSPEKMDRKRKFEPPWLGPFVVVKEKHPDVYKLRNVRTGKLYRRTVNVERLFPFRERTQPQKKQPATGKVVNQGNPRPRATRQRPEPVEGGPDPIDEADEADTETEPLQQGVEPMDGAVVGDEADEADTEIEPHQQGVEPMDGAVVGDEAAETAGPREPDTEAPDDGVTEQHIPEPSDQVLLEAEDQTPPDPPMGVSQEPESSGLRRSTREVKPPQRLRTELLRQRAERLTGTARPERPSFGIHVLGTMMRDLIRKVVP
jgi:hypothetical protein